MDQTTEDNYYFSEHKNLTIYEENGLFLENELSSYNA